MFLKLTKSLLNILFSLGVLIFLSTNIFAQTSYTDWKVKGDKAYDRAAYSEAVGFYLHAFAIGKPDPGDAYNMACCYALIKDQKNAFSYLDVAILNGWTNDAWMLKDNDLNFLHQFPEWLTVVEKTRQKRILSEKKLNKELQAELIKMMTKDQEARKKGIDLIEKHGRNSEEYKTHESIGKAIDKNNTARMKEIVDEFGWPGKTLVGTEGAHAAWLLVQHADLQPNFQKSCLEKMKDLLEINEVSKSDYAYLYDRVKCAYGEQQLFGTQATREPETDKMIFQPIENESELDHRRAAMNIAITASQYAKMIGFDYEVPTAAEAEAINKQRSEKYNKEIELARASVQSGELIKASGHYKTALILNGFINTSDLVDASLICAQLNDQQIEDAFWYLHKAVSRGFNDLKSLEENSDLDKLRSDDRWEELKSRF